MAATPSREIAPGYVRGMPTDHTPTSPRNPDTRADELAQARRFALRATEQAHRALDRAEHLVGTVSALSAAGDDADPDAIAEALVALGRAVEAVAALREDLDGVGHHLRAALASRSSGS